jgi:general stress protein 26
MKVCQKYIKLHDKIKNISIAMLTWADQAGCMHSIPLNTLMTECEGHIWFFIKVDSEIENDLSCSNGINLSYSDPVNRIFVSIAGEAEIIRDKDKIKNLWKPAFTEWFPWGLADSGLVLLRVNMIEANYWDFHLAKMTSLWDFTEAFAIEKQNQDEQNFKY